jgi:hypothetical protein
MSVDYLLPTQSASPQRWGGIVRRVAEALRRVRGALLGPGESRPGSVSPRDERSRVR